MLVDAVFFCHSHELTTIASFGMLVLSPAGLFEGVFRRQESWDSCDFPPRAGRAPAEHLSNTLGDEN